MSAGRAGYASPSSSPTLSGRRFLTALAIKLAWSADARVGGPPRQPSPDPGHGGLSGSLQRRGSSSGLPAARICSGSRHCHLLRSSVTGERGISERAIRRTPVTRGEPAPPRAFRAATLIQRRDCFAQLFSMRARFSMVAPGWCGVLESSYGSYSTHPKAGRLVTPQGRRSRVPDGIECRVDRRAMAQIIGVSVATLDRMVADGLPSETWGRRTRRFLPSEAIAWLRERGR